MTVSVSQTTTYTLYDASTGIPQGQTTVVVTYQNPTVYTGLPPFGSFSSSAFDTINNANLNILLAIPIASRAGRGQSFSYTLTYDSAVWASTAPTQGFWVPAANWWSSLTQVQFGYLTYQTFSTQCSNNGPNYTEFFNFQYVDQRGTSHAFPIAGVSNESQCTSPPASASGIASDNSGYSLTATAMGTGNQATVSLVLTNASGYGMSVPVVQATSSTASPVNGSGSITDTNGNILSGSYSPGNTEFFDTLSSSNPVLKVTGSGTSSSPNVYSFTNPSGNASSYTVNYGNYTVQTKFGCPGVGDGLATPQAAGVDQAADRRNHHLRLFGRKQRY